MRLDLPARPLGEKVIVLRHWHHRGHHHTVNSGGGSAILSILARSAWLEPHMQALV